MSYPLDQPIRLTFNTFSDAAETVPADPTTVSLAILLPDGTTTTVTLAGAQVVRDSLGVFHYDYTPPTAGFYSYRWVATGAVATSETGSFEVATAFDPGIVTLTDVRTHLNFPTPTAASTDDGELQGFIDAATEIVEDYIGAVVTTSVTDAFTTDMSNPAWPYHYGTWPRYTYPAVRSIDLRTLPVQSVTSVTVSSMDGTNPTVLASSSYRLDAVYGTITVIDGSPFGPLVTVVYQAGRATVPATVRLACLELIRHLWESQRGGGSTGLPSLDPDLAGSLPTGSAYAIPNRVAELLVRYAKPPVVA